MGTVLIRCPETRAYVFTGIKMDHATFFDTDIGEHKTICPECGQTHHWRRQDAWLQEWPGKR